MNKGRSYFNILALCLRSRCPVCGRGRLFLPLYRVGSFSELILPPEKCDRCGFRFRREPGYYFGVITPTLPILSLATGLAFVIVDYLCLKPEDPRDLIPIGGLGAVAGLILFWRTSIAIFISFDHAIFPPEWPPGNGP